LRNSGQTILHQAAQEGHSYIIGYLLDSLKAGQHLKTIRDLFLAKDRMGQTAWHLSVENGQLKISEQLWDWAKEAKLNLKNDVLFHCTIISSHIRTFKLVGFYDLGLPLLPPLCLLHYPMSGLSSTALRAERILIYVPTKMPSKNEISF